MTPLWATGCVWSLLGNLKLDRDNHTCCQENPKQTWWVNVFSRFFKNMLLLIHAGLNAVVCVGFTFIWRSFSPVCSERPKSGCAVKHLYTAAMPLHNHAVKEAWTQDGYVNITTRRHTMYADVCVDRAFFRWGHGYDPCVTPIPESFLHGYDCFTTPTVHCHEPSRAKPMRVLGKLYLLLCRHTSENESAFFFFFLQ